MNTLFIVDIQRKYRSNYDESYVDEIINHINENGDRYDRIVSIMETFGKNNGDNIPKEISDKLNFYPVFKSYDASYTISKIQNSKNFKVDNGAIIPQINIPQGDFVIREGKGYIVGERKGNSISMDYMNNELYMLINSLRGDNITLIGGGLYNCVAKTKKFMEFLDVKANIDKKLCYVIDDNWTDWCPVKRFNVYVENKN